MNYWLMKSEPESYSIDHLRSAPQEIGHWDGVRNYQARNFLRDSMQIGDLAFFYHSNCKMPGIAGIATIVSDSYPDYTAFDPDSKYYDPRSNPDKPRWYIRDIKLVTKFNEIIPLSQLRANPKLSTMVILKTGNRLSITPVTKQEWQDVLKMTD